MTVLAPRRIRQARRAALLTLPLLALTACGGAGTASPQPSITRTSQVTGPASPSGSPSASEPGIVAITAKGALVELDPASGVVTRTLVASGVTPGEVSVSPDGKIVYFASGTGCSPRIESVPAAGGSPTVITPGWLPAISPDGTKLAYSTEPPMVYNCYPSGSDITAGYSLTVRTLATGQQQVFSMSPALRSSGLPFPISYLSWAADSTRIAVSVQAIQDNEGWALDIVDTSQAQYYTPGPGVASVPITAGPSPVRSYIRQGIFLPGGDLFISRACCGGVPIQNTSRLMWEVTTSGAFVHQVAFGFKNLEHTSLAADPSGHWLLYIAAAGNSTTGGDLYVSDDGATPSKIASGLLAAAWL